MKLPNGDRAIIEIEKLRDYCLNPRHPYGRHKARLFRSALDFDQSKAEELRTILQGVAAKDDARHAEIDAHGQRFVVEFTVAGKARPVAVRSCWIIRHGEDIPRLTSCYVLRRK